MARDVKLKSGSSHKIYSVQVEFRGFHPRARSRKDTIQLSKKWIYIFKRSNKKASYASLYAEIFVNENGEFAEVDLTSGTKSDRKPSVKTKKTVRLGQKINWEQNYLYIFLSDIQLPLKRIDDYTIKEENILRLSKRSWIYGEASWLVNSQELHWKEIKEDIIIFYFVDYLAELKYLQEKYVESLDKYYKYVNDVENDSKYYLARLTQQVAKAYAKEDPDVWDWLGDDGNPLNKYVHDIEKEIRNLSYRFERYAGLKKSLVEWPVFDVIRNDYVGEENIDKWIINEGVILARTRESKSGREYLEKEVNKTNSWINQFLNGNITGLAGKSNAVYEAFADILEQWSVTKIKITSFELFTIEYVRVFESMLLVNPKFDIFDPGNLKWIPEEHFYSRTQVRITKYHFRAISIENEKLIKNKLPRIFEKVIAVLDLINFALAVKKYGESKNARDLAKNSLNFAGASLSLLQHLDDKMLKELGLPKAKVLGLVGSILDYISSVWETAEASYKGEEGLTTGHAVSALGATFMGAGTALSLSGSGALAFGLGASAWTGIGAVIVMTGFILVWIFTESDWEKWFKSCEWGDNYDGKTRSKQLEELFKLIGKPKFQIELRDKNNKKTLSIPKLNQGYSLAVILEPAFYLPNETTYEVMFDIVQNYSTISNLKVKMPTVDDKISSKDDDVKSIEKKISWDFIASKDIGSSVLHYSNCKIQATFKKNLKSIEYKMSSRNLTKDNYSYLPPPGSPGRMY